METEYWWDVNVEQPGEQDVYEAQVEEVAKRQARRAAFKRLRLVRKLQATKHLHKSEV